MSDDHPFCVKSPDGRWALELVEDEDFYVVTVCLDGAVITDSFRSQDSDKIIAWAQRQMVQIMRRDGSHDGQ